MKEQLAKIRAEALEALAKAADPAALDELRVKYLGKKGELTAVLKQMGSLSAEERPQMGQLANQVRAALEEALEVQARRLESAACTWLSSLPVITAISRGVTRASSHRISRICMSRVENMSFSPLSQTEWIYYSTDKEIM